MPKLSLICQQCEKPFERYPSQIRNGRGKFCSKECLHQNLKGHQAWNYQPKVDRVCQYCGTHFQAPIWRVNQGKAKFCSRRCSTLAIFAPYRGRKLLEQTKRKLSRITKRMWQDLEMRKRILEAMRGRWQQQEPERKTQILENLSAARKKNWGNPEFVIKMSQVHKELWQDREFVKRMSEAQSKAALQRWQNPQYRQHQVEAQRRSWQDPEVVAKRLAGLNKKPTKPEERLISILQKHHPQFRYNGDFSLGVALGGLIPDFINVNGRKEVIEVLGDYFHSPEIIGDRWQGSELGKVMLYNSLGYRCLVIWEHELKELTEGEIVNKVNLFRSSKGG